MNEWAAVVPLAAKSGEAAKAGPIGLAVIVLLCVACYFLFKSMSKHLRNVRDNFPSDPPASDAGFTVDGRAARVEGTHAGQAEEPSAARAEEPHRNEP